MLHKTSQQTNPAIPLTLAHHLPQGKTNKQATERESERMSFISEETRYHSFILFLRILKTQFLYLCLVKTILQTEFVLCKILLLAPHFSCYFGIILVNKYVDIFPKLCLWGVLLKTNKKPPHTMLVLKLDVPKC